MPTNDVPSAKSSEPLLVRLMEMKDTAAVARLATQLGYASTAAQIEQRFRILETSSEATVFVAESPDRRVVGWIHVFVSHALESDADVEIGGLVVEEAVRGRGVGTALIATAERWTRERGYHDIAVRANVIRAAAHAFYKLQKYEIVKSQYKLKKKLV